MYVYLINSFDIYRIHASLIHNQYNTNYNVNEWIESFMKRKDYTFPANFIMIK